MKATVYNDDLGKDIEITDIPADMMDEAKEWREKMLEAVAGSDEVLMEKYLNGEELSEDEIIAGMREHNCRRICAGFDRDSFEK